MISDPQFALTPSPIVFAGRDKRAYNIAPMDHGYASKHSARLRALQELIPYVGSDTTWMTEDTRSQQQGRHRWTLSFAVEHSGEPIGFLSAYLRDYSQGHPFRSVYVHRMCVAKEHQRNYVGAQLIGTALSIYFEAMPWLLTVTLQTNDEQANAAVLTFYERCGFRSRYRVAYPDKVDTLMELERNDRLRPGVPFGDFAGMSITQRPPVRGLLSDASESHLRWDHPNVFFGTTSNEKFLQYRALVRSYGLQLRPLRQRVSLTEPQVEAGPAAEAALVSGPLKLFSRFAAKNTSFPVMVEDTMLFIEHFNNHFDDNPILPGPDTKRWWMALQSEGVLRLLGSSQRRSAKYVCQIGINYAPGQYQYFRHEQPGKISREVRIASQAEDNFPFTNATFFHSIFIPTGSPRTLAEMDANEFLSFDYRRSCLSKALPLLRMGQGPFDGQLALFATP